MGPGTEPSLCSDEELVEEFELACRGGDSEFSEQYKEELISRLVERL